MWDHRLSQYQSCNFGSDWNNLVWGVSFQESFAMCFHHWHHWRFMRLLSIASDCPEILLSDLSQSMDLGCTKSRFRLFSKHFQRPAMFSLPFAQLRKFFAVARSLEIFKGCTVDAKPKWEWAFLKMGYLYCKCIGWLLHHHSPFSNGRLGRILYVHTLSLVSDTKIHSTTNDLHWKGL